MGDLALPWVLAVLAAAGGSGAAWWVVRRRRGPDFPDLLAREYGREEVFEKHGLQLTVVDFPDQLSVGEVGEVVFALQNAVDGPRTLRLRLHSSRRPGGPGPHLRAAEVDATLEGGEVAVLRVPITPASLTRGFVWVTPVVDVEGPSARRVRRGRGKRWPEAFSRRARRSEDPVPDRGLRLEMRVPAEGHEDPSAELPLSSAEVIWAPGLEPPEPS